MLQKTTVNYYIDLNLLVSKRCVSTLIRSLGLSCFGVQMERLVTFAGMQGALLNLKLKIIRPRPHVKP